MPSNVSGGFWLQLPSGLASFMPPAQGAEQLKLQIELRCNDALQAASGWTYALDRTPAKGEMSSWPAIYLLRGKGGAGLSGGWRGFSIDQVRHCAASLGREGRSAAQVRRTCTNHNHWQVCTWAAAPIRQYLAPTSVVINFQDKQRRALPVTTSKLGTIHFLTPSKP